MAQVVQVVSSRHSPMASSVNQENALEAPIESDNDWVPPPPPPFQRDTVRNLVEYFFFNLQKNDRRSIGIWWDASISYFIAPNILKRKSNIFQNLQ